MDMPLMVDTKNAQFTGHKDIGQNFQNDKDETNKASSATVLKSLLSE